MKLVEITSQSAWDAFITSVSWSSFPQSWAWGEFQRSQGHKVRRFQFQDGKRVILAAQLIYEKRRFSGYWFAPRGPVMNLKTTDDIRAIMEAFLQALADEGFTKETLFWRIEPMLELEQAKGAFPTRMKRVHAMNPAATRLIDLSESEEELLKQMHQKTRYNIRLAAKHGVAVREGTMDDLETFLRLTKETAERDEFTARSASYLKKTYTELMANGFARLRLAEFEGKALAANMEIHYGDTATYLHGASSSENRNLMAPFLLQWEAMRAAKQEGKTRYDLWGCNPDFKSSFYYKPTWEGISRFKAGFGGRLVHLAGTWDLPINRFFYTLAFPKTLFR